MHVSVSLVRVISHQYSKSFSQPVQSGSHACIVGESWDHVIPACLSVRKTPHLSLYQRRSLSLQLVDEDSERGELAWRHRTHYRQARPYHEHGTLHLRGGARSTVSWNSDNAQDNTLVQDEYEERCRCSYCPWFDHLSTHCETPHHLCSTRMSGWCCVPCHHRFFHNQMPNTCPYGGRRKHANGHYLTRQCTAWQLSLEDRQVEYDHLEAGCDNLCKGEMSRAGVAMRQAITQVVLDEFEGGGPSYAPHSPSPPYNYVPGDNKGSD
jgi:hypothetical protein